MVVPGFLINKYTPIKLKRALNGMPQYYLKILTRFTVEDDISSQKHIEVLCAFVGNLNVENLDIVMRLFVQSLDGELRKWFNILPNDSISTW